MSMNPIFAGFLFKLLQSMKVVNPEQLPENDPILIRAQEAAQDVDAVFEDESIRKRLDKNEINPWKKMTFTMHGKEASFSANPKGSNDNGNACGALQVWAPWLPEGLTCKQVRASRKLGLRAGVIVALNFRDKCGGGLGEAWSAFAMGRCGPKGMALEVILERCKIAGVSCK
jgi:hypothetical protein